MGIRRSQLSLALLITSPHTDGPLNEFERTLAPLTVRRLDRHRKTAVLGFPGRLGSRGNDLVRPDALRDECKAGIERLAPLDDLDDHGSAFTCYFYQLVRNQPERPDVVVVHLDDRAGLEVFRGRFALFHRNAFFDGALGDHVQCNSVRHGYASM